MRKFFMYFFAVTVIAVIFAVPCTATEPADFEEFETEVFFRRVKEVELPIVMYHLVTEKPKYIGKYGISPAELEADLKFLKENKYNTVVMQDLIDFVNSGKQLPDNPVMLTFDDGNASDYHILLSLLQEYDMKAVLAVLGSASDKCTADAEKNPKAKYPNLTWPQIIELHESGHAEIQSHSYDMHKAPLGSSNKRGEDPGAYHARLLSDLQKFQDACATHLNYVPTTFVYPLGAMGKNSREVLEELGMVASISCQEGLNVIRQGDKDCLFKLLRTNRPSGRSIGDVLKSINVAK
ncbi:MAG: polysaccharide deacetylase family protein [Defluviitaleaceae bacterium]|nr:polysaccharide deacetylase family protein [Defluviitaleaceae bacterium]MCL2261804.1 polysaccharide deacetylase family protein [Defluviitaleaceae bacterium]